LLSTATIRITPARHLGTANRPQRALVLICRDGPADYFYVELLRVLALAHLLAQAANSGAQQTPSSNAVMFKVTHAEAGQPQFVRVFYLEEGIRVTALRPPSTIIQQPEDAEAGQKNPAPEVIRIVNVDDGERAIVVQPPTN